MAIYGASGSDEIEELGAVPHEPMYGVEDRYDKLASLVLDFNDDLQDEIGERRAQFEAAVNMVDELEHNIDRQLAKKFEAVYTAMAVCYAIGGVALCLILGVMILNI